MLSFLTPDFGEYPAIPIKGSKGVLQVISGDFQKGQLGTVAIKGTC